MKKRGICIPLQELRPTPAFLPSCSPPEQRTVSRRRGPFRRSRGRSSAASRRSHSPTVGSRSRQAAPPAGAGRGHRQGSSLPTQKAPARGGTGAGGVCTVSPGRTGDTGSTHRSDCRCQAACQLKESPYRNIGGDRQKRERRGSGNPGRRIPCQMPVSRSTDCADSRRTGSSSGSAANSRSPRRAPVLRIAARVVTTCLRIAGSSPRSRSRSTRSSTGRPLLSWPSAAAAASRTAGSSSPSRSASGRTARGSSLLPSASIACSRPAASARPDAV